MIVTVAIGQIFSTRLFGIADQIMDLHCPLMLVGKRVKHAGNQRKSHDQQDAEV